MYGHENGQMLVGANAIWNATVRVTLHKILTQYLKALLLIESCLAQSRWLSSFVDSAKTP